MSGARRKVIALLTCNASLRDDYQGALRLGIERSCVANDIDLWVYAGHNNWTFSRDEHRLFRLLDPSRVDGIILAAGLIESFASFEDVLSFERPARSPCARWGEKSRACLRSWWTTRAPLRALPST